MAKRKKVRTKTVGHRKMEMTMQEFSKGALRSSSGQLVTKPAQAKVIGLSKQRKADQKKRRKSKK